MAYFRLRKPDGKAVLNTATIERTSNTVLVTLTAQALAVSGRGYADITLYNSQQQVLSSVSFVLIIMSAPGVVEQITSSNEFTYLQQIVDDANTVIKESEAWAIGTRGGVPVTEYSFNPGPVIGNGNVSYEVNELVFRNKVGVHPGFTNEHRFTYAGSSVWNYTNPLGETLNNISLANYGITTTGTFFSGNYFTISVTDPDLQYHNNAKYWAESTINAKDAIENLEISSTVIDADDTPTVDKEFINDVNVTYKPSQLSVTVNATTFLRKVTEKGNHNFLYNAGRWYYKNSAVTLSNYGISYSGTPIEGDYITILYAYHGHFTFNIPRGPTGNVNFMTFEIDPKNGLLYMHRPTDLTQVSFELISTGENEGCLGVRINTGG